MAGLGSREEHQEKQPEPIDEAKNLGVGGGEVRDGGQASKECGAEYNPGKDFSDDARLAQAGEEVAQQLRKSDEEQKDEKNRGQAGV